MAVPLSQNCINHHTAFGTDVLYGSLIWFFFKQKDKFFNLYPSEASGTTTQQAGIKNLLKAAMVVKSTYIMTLHESLFKFLDNLIKKFTQLLEYFYKDVKHQENCSDLAHLPKSIKHLD